MADQPKADDQPEGKPQASSKGGVSRRLFNAATSRTTLAVLLGISLVMQGVGFWFYRSTTKSQPPEGEVTLGEFVYQENQPSTAAIKTAQFTLHLDLLEAVDQKARGRLEERRFRVKQDVEELMRMAKGADFEPTAMDQLKRTLQERINASLDMRAIDEVIITDLRIQRRPTIEVAETPTTESTAPSPAG